MKKAVIYARVSTTKQAEEGVSIDAQLKQLKKYAANNGYEVAEQYVDRGASAKTADRPAFQKMIAEIKANKDRYDAVLIHKTDRFARNREDSIIYKSLLRRDCNVDVISITEEFGDGAIGNMIEGILEVIAEFYSENLSKEVLKGMQEKAKKGEVLGELPLGYKSQNKKIVIDKDEAKIIKYIFQQYKNGKSMQDISLELQKNGEAMFGEIIHNKSKSKTRPLPVPAISKILKNDIYIGTYNWKDTTIENNHPAIVDEEVFDLVQDRINNNTYQRKGSKDYLLKGLATCYECGGNMSQVTERYEKADGSMKIYRRLRCTNHVKLKNCYSNMHRMEEVNQTLIDYLKDVSKGSITTDNLDIVQTSNNTLMEELERLQNKYDSFDKQFDRQMEAYQSGVIELEQLQEYKEQLQQEKEDTKKEIEQIKKKINNQGVNANNFREQIKNVAAALENEELSLNKKKNLLLKKISEVRLSKQKDLMEVVFKH